MRLRVTFGSTLSRTTKRKLIFYFNILFLFLLLLYYYWQQWPSCYISFNNAWIVSMQVLLTECTTEYSHVYIRLFNSIRVIRVMLKLRKITEGWDGWKFQNLLLQSSDAFGCMWQHEAWSNFLRHVERDLGSGLLLHNSIVLCTCKIMQFQDWPLYSIRLRTTLLLAKRLLH